MSDIGSDLPVVLSELLNGKPILERSVRAAQRNREALGRLFAGSPFCDGVEELLGMLRSHSKILAEDEELARIAFLIDRIEGDIVAAFECLLCGMHSVVSDLMRPVMEAEYLFSDFTADPQRITKWLAMAPKERWNQFKPVELRRRRARRQGQDPDKDIAHLEYHLHSAGIHFGPSSTWFASRGIAESQNEQAVTICLGEILEHGRRLLLTLNALCKTRCKSTPTQEALQEQLPSFFRAWESVQLRIEVWKELEGRDERETLDNLFPEDGPVDMLRVLRYGYARMIANKLKEAKDKGRPSGQ
jgi:hypothetical protein